MVVSIECSIPEESIGFSLVYSKVKKYDHWQFALALSLVPRFDP